MKLDELEAGVSPLQHLSIDLIESYVERRIRPDELLSLDDHLKTCANCREILRELRSKPAALAVLRTSLQPSRDVAASHLTESQLASYVLNRIDEADREIAQSHLEDCRLCAAAASRVQLEPKSSAIAERPAAETTLNNDTPSIVAGEPAFAAKKGVHRTAPNYWMRMLQPPRILWLGGIAASLIILAVVVSVRFAPTTPSARVAVDQPSKEEPAENPAKQPDVPLTSNSLVLLDGGVKIERDNEGKLLGLESLSELDQRMIKAAVEQGTIEVPGSVSSLRESSGVIMGTTESTSFSLLSPVGKIVPSDRPTLRWAIPIGATSFKVTITDPSEGYKEVAVSPELKAPAWRVDKPLERGRTYTWQVTAQTENGEVKAPGSSAGEAKFRVLEQSTFDELSYVRKQNGGRHLVLGLRYSAAGLLDEAEREFKALLVENQNSQIAKNLVLQARLKAR